MSGKEGSIWGGAKMEPAPAFELGEDLEHNRLVQKKKVL